MTSAGECTYEQVTSDEKEVRVWMDGCFDMVHASHAIAIYRARRLGHKLHLGIQSDATICKVKGPPVYTEEERARLLRGLKWVDEVYIDVPYGTTTNLLDKYNCDFCAHGDDPTIAANDEDILWTLVKAKRIRFFQRGFGSSTSDLIERILQLTETTQNGHTENLGSRAVSSSIFADFSTTTGPKPGAKVVYVAGTFSIFHVGHQAFLEKAASLGDYLVVGVYSDETARWCKGPVHPVVSLSERGIRVLACKCVSEVLIGAPFILDHNIIDHYKVSVVCHGQTQVSGTSSGPDPFMVAKELGIFQSINSGCDVTTDSIIERITARRTEYVERSKKKREKNALGDECVRKKGNHLVAITGNGFKEN